MVQGWEELMVQGWEELMGGANGTGWEGLMVQGKRIKYEEMEGERVCQQKAAITKAPSRKSFKTC